MRTLRLLPGALPPLYCGRPAASPFQPRSPLRATAPSPCVKQRPTCMQPGGLIPSRPCAYRSFAFARSMRPQRWACAIGYHSSPGCCLPPRIGFQPPAPLSKRIAVTNRPASCADGHLGSSTSARSPGQVGYEHRRACAGCTMHKGRLQWPCQPSLPRRYAESPADAEPEVTLRNQRRRM